MELTIAHSVEAEIEAALKCEIDAERDIRIGCRRVIGRLVRIGPISLDCRFKIVGSGSIETRASWNACRPGS